MGHRGIGKQRANNIVDGFDFSFGFTILGGSMRTRKSKCHPMLDTKFMKRSIIKLTTNVALKIFDFSFKLSVDICAKRQEYIVKLGLG